MQVITIAMISTLQVHYREILHQINLCLAGNNYKQISLDLQPSHIFNKSTNK